MGLRRVTGLCTAIPVRSANSLGLKGKGTASKCHHIIGSQSYPLLTICVPDAVPDACVLGLSLDFDLQERKRVQEGLALDLKPAEALALPLDGDICCSRLNGDSEPLLE